MDGAVTHWINSLAGNFTALDMVMIASTKFGVPVVILCVASQWWSKRDRFHVRHTAIAAGLSFLIGLGFNQAILLFVHRVRPYDAGLTHLIIPPSGDWSFPSDHATAAFAVVAAFAMQNLRWRTFLLLLMAILIAWSRIFVGTHYLTDVIGGACTGIGAAVLVRVFYRERSRLDRIVTAIL